MITQKSTTLILCIPIVLALFQCTSGATRNNLRVGRLGPTDTLLQSETIKKDWNIRGNVEAVFSYTHPGITKITYIEALDQSNNGHGAKPSIIKGGVGYNFVDMKFRSEVFRGIDFVVKIYGADKK